jgi:hypothetical protein
MKRARTVELATGRIPDQFCKQLILKDFFMAHYQTRLALE